MNWKDTYTKIFLKQTKISISPANIKIYSRKWWQNNRNKDKGGLRLTDEGFDFCKNTLDLKLYEIPFLKNNGLTTETIIFLDQFITCPYYLTQKSIFVTDEKKAMELHLFSGDMQKYGLAKAMSRYE